MSTIKYKFSTQEDFLFYILNAVGHDFIHDFNNYERMSKILTFINGLVKDVEISEPGTPAAVADDEGTGDMVHDEQAVLPNNTEPGTPAAVADNEGTGDMVHDEGTGDMVHDEQVVLLNNTESGIPDAVVDDKGSGDIVDVKESEIPVDELTKDLTTEILEESQIEENFYSEPIQLINIDTSSETQIQKITNVWIQKFNEIAAPISSLVKTRLTTKKINTLQHLKDFIQESKFLIISKLTSPPGSRGGVKRNKKQKGGNGINIITRNDIVTSIKDIIEEIKETTPQNLQLISYFEYIMHSYLNLSIPGISPLEIFNNSLIEDSVSIFIVGQCNNTNIKEHAKLCLTALLSVPSTSKNVTDNVLSLPMNKAKEQSDFSKFMARGVAPSRRGIPTSLGRQQGGNKIIVGGAFNGTTYNLPENIDIFKQFDAIIIDFKRTTLYINYINCTLLQNLSDTRFVGQIYSEYENFITRASNIEGKNVIELIVGKQMFNVKRTIIMNKKIASKRDGRNLSKNIQEMVDTITDLIFVKTIDVYNDVKNRVQARSEDSGDGSSITGSAKDAVQNVSKLVAFKILELTGAPKSSIDADLNTQIEILNNIAQKDKGYTIADDVLITHFIKTYRSNPNVFVGQDALTKLNSQIASCKKSNCRVINNAVPSFVKSQISDFVVCPTSSVCDGMGSFGSCVNPAGKKEYANMNFSLTYGDESNFYYGQTNIKSDLTSVNINYGIGYGKLQIYNFIDIKLDSQPIVLQANYVFKNLINRIIELWKIAPAGTPIDELWRYLYGTDYFLSVLKLGSQKAVGDIFQEINSTLFNGGYNVPVQNLQDKNTYGLMGDRPSGIRVFKLLNIVVPVSETNQGKNPKASGGYVGGDTTFMYFSQVAPSPSLTKRKGGNKITRKRKYKITNKYYRRRGKQTKRKNKHNKTK